MVGDDTRMVSFDAAGRYILSICCTIHERILQSLRWLFFIVIYFVFYFDIKNLIYIFFVSPVFDVFCAGSKVYAECD